MAKISEAVAIVVGAQSALGTVNADVLAATIVANIDDGSPLSAGEALGLVYRSDSLKLDIDRDEEDPDVFPGTLSRTPGSFLRSVVNAFSFDIPVKGSGRTVDGTPSAGDYTLPAAVEAILSGVGLVRGTEGTGSTTYVLDTAVYLSFKVWRNDVSYTIQDCLVESITYNLTPGQVVTATIKVAAGSVTFNASDTFPTSIDYGLQEDTTSPVLKLAGAAIGATTRGFLDGKLAVTLTADEFPDSNATEGLVNESSDRAITWDGSFYVDTTNEDQDYTNLIDTTPSEELTFTLGVHVIGPAEIANALGFAMNNMDFTQVGFDRQANRVVYKLKGYATHNGSGDDEFLLTAK